MTKSDNTYHMFNKLKQDLFNIPGQTPLWYESVAKADTIQILYSNYSGLFWIDTRSRQIKHSSCIGKAHEGYKEAKSILIVYLDKMGVLRDTKHYEVEVLSFNQHFKCIITESDSIEVHYKVNATICDSIKHMFSTIKYMFSTLFSLIYCLR